MFPNVLLLACLSQLALGVHTLWIPENEKIVNGTDAKPGEIPYIVSLRYQNSYHICGASILDELHILTAAHCGYKYNYADLSIQFGVLDITSDDQIIKVVQVFTHEEYSYYEAINDIAVLKLESPIPIGDNVQPIVLPQQDEQPPANKWAVLAGWGYQHTEGEVTKLLQRVDQLVYSDRDCKDAYGGRVNAIYNVCAGVPEGGKGQCKGDSGGPLVSHGKQYGVVSWSVKPCGSKGNPGVFTRVPSYVNWINEKRLL